ncbi:MAG: nucleoside deaminase [Candidatus Melainabacteria bacterium]
MTGGKPPQNRVKSSRQRSCPLSPPPDNPATTTTQRFAAPPVLSVADQRVWMQAAMAEARRALPEDVPVGALILRTDPGDPSEPGDPAQPVGAPVVVGRGHNRRERDASPLGHAELIAVAEAAQTLGRWRLSDCLLIVTLEPCAMCASALLQARIGGIVFGAWDPLQGGLGGGALNLAAPEHRGPLPLPAITGGIEEPACRGLVEDFFRTRD